MSVLACNRKGCNNIMCDRLSSEYGYLCYDCFHELVNLGVSANIELFMASKPVNIDASYAYYNEIFNKQGE